MTDSEVLMRATATLGLCLALSATPAPAADPEAARVLPLGVFHFKDAGLDVAQVEDFDVMTPEAQAVLEALAQRLANFEPTAVLLEYDPDNEDSINERYAGYLAGEFDLPANEVYQLGFRIAAKAGLERVDSFDHRQVQWLAEPLFEYAAANESPEMVELRRTIASFEKQETEARRSKGLLELLASHNDPARDRMNMDLYLLTNALGAGDGWQGADATASWWHRNFRMYANIQRQAAPAARVIAIGGSGHMAIIKQLLAIDQRIEMEDPLPYLVQDAAGSAGVGHAPPDP